MKLTKKIAAIATASLITVGVNSTFAYNTALPNPSNIMNAMLISLGMPNSPEGQSDLIGLSKKHNTLQTNNNTTSAITAQSDLNAKLQSAKLNEYLCMQLSSQATCINDYKNYINQLKSQINTNKMPDTTTFMLPDVSEMAQSSAANNDDGTIAALQSYLPELIQNSSSNSQIVQGSIGDRANNITQANLTSIDNGSAINASNTISKYTTLQSILGKNANNLTFDIGSAVSAAPTTDSKGNSISTFKTATPQQQKALASYWTDVIGKGWVNSKMITCKSGDTACKASKQISDSSQIQMLHQFSSLSNSYIRKVVGDVLSTSVQQTTSDGKSETPGQDDNNILLLISKSIGDDSRNQNNVKTTFGSLQELNKKMTIMNSLMLFQIHLEMQSSKESKQQLLLEALNASHTGMNIGNAITMISASQQSQKSMDEISKQQADEKKKQDKK